MPKSDRLSQAPAPIARARAYLRRQSEDAVLAKADKAAAGFLYAQGPQTPDCGLLAHAPQWSALIVRGEAQARLGYSAWRTLTHEWERNRAKIRIDAAWRPAQATSHAARLGRDAVAARTRRGPPDVPILVSDGDKAWLKTPYCVLQNREGDVNAWIEKALPAAKKRSPRLQADRFEWRIAKDLATAAKDLMACRQFHQRGGPRPAAAWGNRRRALCRNEMRQW